MIDEDESGAVLPPGGSGAHGQDQRSTDDLLKDWKPSPDGSSVTRVVVVTSRKDAARLVAQVIAYSVSHGAKVSIHCDGHSIELVMPINSPRRPIKGKRLDKTGRGLLRRLDRLITTDSERTEAGSEAA